MFQSPSRTAQVLTFRPPLNAGRPQREVLPAAPRGFRGALPPELPLGSCTLVVHRDDGSLTSTAAA